MAVVCAAQFVLQLDFSIVNVSLATVQREFPMAPADLQWIVTGYALTFGSLLLVGGRLADYLGRRRLLVLGLVIFGIASLTCGLAVGPVMLIISRFAQGAAGALVSPAALSLLTTSHAEGQARTRALAIWQATTAAGATAGVVFGGLLTEYLGWRAVFLVNPPIIVILLALVPLLPHGRPEQARAKVDYWGALLITGSLALLIFGLSNGQQNGFTSPASLVAFALAVSAGVAFVVTERSVVAPMLPLRILSDPARRTAIGAMLMIGGVLAAYVYFISLYMQHVLGYSPVRTGLGLLPSTLTLVLTTTFLARRLLSRFGVKPVLIAGLVSMAGGQVWLAQLGVGSDYVTAVLPGLLLTALGVALALPGASVAITNGVARADQGLAGALFTTSQQTGAAVGLAILATAAATRTAHAVGSTAQTLTDGYRLSFLIGGGIVSAGALLVAVGMRPPRRSEVAVEGDVPGNSDLVGRHSSFKEVR